MIVNAGLARVVFASPYPDPLAEQLLRDATIDLARLRDLESPISQMLVRYLQMIQVQRQDFNGRMLTVRRDPGRVSRDVRCHRSARGVRGQQGL